MSIVVASILDADRDNFRGEIEAVDQAGVDAFSVDVMDGKFAPRVSFGPDVVAELRSWTRKPIEAHLMIERPEDTVGLYLDAGADAVVFHLEATDVPLDVIQVIHARGRLAGAALLMDTPTSALSDELLRALDIVNLLAVSVGFGGSATASDTPERITDLRERAAALGTVLAVEVDGGVKPHNCGDYAAVGADMLTIGTGIYKADSYADALAEAHAALAPFVDRSAPRIAGFMATPSLRAG